MLNRNQISLFIVSFLLVGFFFLALPEKGLAQGGCCRTADTLSCLGCVSGCAATENYCEAQGGSFQGSVEACVSEFGDCEDLPDDTRGCCLRADNICSEDRTFDECFQDDLGQFWNANEACTEVPECQEARPVPTMNQWGMIALAVILGVIGILVYRRRKAAA